MKIKHCILTISAITLTAFTSVGMAAGYGSSGMGTYNDTMQSRSGTQAKDLNITTNVKKMLNKTAFSGTDIDVSTNQGVVTLDGTVTNRNQAEAAKKAAKAVPGVKRVDSNIRIK